MALHFEQATGVFAKTLPFVILRMGIGVLLGVVAVAYFGAVLWVALTFLDGESTSTVIVALVLVVASVVFYKAWQLFSRYVLYLVKAAHIAVIAHVVETGEVPANQVQFGKDQVKSNFAQTSVLFGVDQLVKAVIKQFNRSVLSGSGLLSLIPSGSQLLEFVKRSLTLAATYIDEAIVAHMFVSDEENGWRAARDGVILYAKNWKPVLGSTVLIVAGMYVVTILLVLALIPWANVLSGLSPTYEIVGWVATGGILLTLYAGVMKPWVKTVIITTFLIESRDDTPDSQTANWIEERSSKFSELVAEANAADADVPVQEAE